MQNHVFSLTCVDYIFNCAVRSSDLTIHKFTTLTQWHFEVEKLESFIGKALLGEIGQVGRPDRT